MEQVHVENTFRCWLALVTLLLTFSATAQISFSEIPADQQLIARQGDSSAVTFHVRGSVAGASMGQSLTAVLRRGEQLVDSSFQELSFADGAAGFGVSLQLPVTRANHTLTVAVDGQVMATVTELVAGDVFIVNGQSNAVANFALSPVDRDSFLRGYQVELGWHHLQFGNPGEWMGRTAHRLSEAEDVPVAVFNFAVGAQRLDYFEPGGSANYEEAQAVLKLAEVLGRVRGLCWFQGEADGWEASTASYTRDLSQLFDVYREGFGVKHFYGFQTRTYACGHLEPYVMEAQRRLSRARQDVDFVASTNAINDSCHFPYEGGYELLGNRLAEVIRLRQYGGTDPRVLSPDVDSARIVSATQIQVYYQDHGAGLAVTGRPWGEFRAEGLNLRPITGQIIGAQILLTFGSDISNARGLSYLNHAGPAIDAVQNATGVGAFTFYNVSLAPGDGAPGNRPDVELSLRSNTEQLAVATVFEAQAVVRNTGRASVQEFTVHVPLPRPQLIYVGGNEGEPSYGSFNPTEDLWTVPGLAPGDSAVLKLNYFTSDATGPTTLWAEVDTAVEQIDDQDSQTGNGVVGIVSEDDEARIVFNDRGQDCGFRVEARQVGCSVNGGDTTLTLTLEALQTRSEDLLLLRAPDGGEQTWTSGEGLSLSLKLDPQYPSRGGSVTFEVSRVADPTCGTRVAVSVAKGCSLGPLGTDDASARPPLKAYPNPVLPGATVSVQLPALEYDVDARPELYDALGRRLPIAALVLDPSGLLTLTAPEQAGLYFLRAAGSVATLLVR